MGTLTLMLLVAILTPWLWVKVASAWEGLNLFSSGVSLYRVIFEKRYL